MRSLLDFIIHIFSWRHTIEFLEYGRERGGIVKATSIHDLRDIHIMTSQQISSLLQSDVANEVMRCLACQLLHLAMQVYTADSHLVSYLVDAEV